MTMKKEYLIYKLSDEIKNTCKIPNEAFQQYGVKRGLRNEDGSGVLVGLTNIGNVVGYERDKDGNIISCPGAISNALMDPGKHEAKAIIPSPPCAV
mgnify:CR=1 FL=1